MALVHYCPACQEEFRPDVLRCSDCGGVLVPHDDESGTPPPGEADPDPMPELEGEAVTLVGVDRAFHLDPLVARLARHGVLSRVETSPGRFRLQVGEGDKARALELLAELLPAVPALELAPTDHPDGFDHETGAYAACPACGEPTAGGPECPACGLALGAAEGDEGAR
jgi:hypothetical protein